MTLILKWWQQSTTNLMKFLIYFQVRPRGQQVFFLFKYFFPYFPLWWIISRLLTAENKLDFDFLGISETRLKTQPHGHNQQFRNCKIMPIYKIKEQIMKNLLFTFPKYIFTEHLYFTYHIYRYKQNLTDIEKLRILITITSNHVSNK